jgi:hypothetical protein
MVEQGDPPAAPTGFDCAHHAGRARSQNYDIDFLHAVSVALSLESKSDRLFSF